MSRRSPYTKVEKTGQVRAEHVRGMGDVAFKGFQCLNGDCEEFIFVRADSITDAFEIPCPRCGNVLESGDDTKFYDYVLRDLRDDSIIEQGEFAVSHDEYVAEASLYKYCIVCNTMKPLSLFDSHGSRASGRQGECRLCKKTYNSIKNQSRTTDQHREAAQKRRLYLDLSGNAKIDGARVAQRFNNCCFKCGKDLSSETDPKERPLDHTLPAVYLWPLTTENATLLCRDHNGEKSGKWPSVYYSDQELRRLAVTTGISYQTLTGPAHYNPTALTQLKDAAYVDRLLQKYAAYMPEIIKLRNRILRDTGFDFFAVSATLSPQWIQQANAQLPQVNQEPDTDAL